MINSSQQHFVQPVLQYDDEADDLWVFEDDYRHTWVDPKTRRLERLTIPKGTKYDKASVPPWIPPTLARRDGPWEGPSALHDMVYKYLQHGGAFPDGMYQVLAPDGEWVNGPQRNRVWADWLLRSTAQATGRVSTVDQWKYWGAVRYYPPNWFKGF